MSTKPNIHRKSDVGIQNAAENVSVKVKADTKRRQTIADITTKENATGSKRKSVAIEPTHKRLSVASPFKHHHAPVALGAAASHYFKGLPQTPVQKMIRSEQQKMILQASMQVEEEENTESILANQSYLSSSSSSGGRNSSRDEAEVLNSSVLSDTTELTASNFLVLAATHRTTAEDLKRIAEERRQPLSTIQVSGSKEELVAMSAQGVKRRQSMSVGIVSDNTMEEKKAIPRRRETLATIPQPRSAPSPMEIPVMASKSQRSQPRERNKVADYQRRQSDSSFTSNVAASITSRRRSSIAPTRETDGTTELSISSSDMKKLLSKSMAGDGTDFASPGRNSEMSDGPVDGSSRKSPSSKVGIGVDTNALSPARNTRSATKKAVSSASKSKEIEKESVILFQSPSRPSRRSTPKKSPQSKAKNMTEDNLLHLSPARSTRSATKQLAVESSVDLTSTEFDLSLPCDRQSTPKKSPQSKPKNMIEDNLFHLSPARSTRSATKKIAVESSVDPTSTKFDLSLTDDTTENVSDVFNGVESYLNNKLASGDTTASLGNLLDAFITEDASRLDTSVTPTARNTRSAQKERTQSFATECDMFASSPARNTRSAQNKKGAASPGRDDTAQLLLDLAAGTFQSIPQVDMTSSTKTSKLVSDAPTSSDTDILNDLVVQYSTSESLKSTGGSPKRNVDTSQESTISLHDLLSEYLPQLQTGALDEASNDGGKSSASSLSVRSAVSKASTIDTPQGMSDSDAFSGLNVSAAPNSPPSTIRFSVMDESSVLDTSYVGQSPFRKALTPSRLAASPRRFVHSTSNNRSPFKSALTPSRLPASPYRLSNSMVATRNQSAQRLSLPLSSLPASPLRVKRSADKKEMSSAVKRQKTFGILQDLAKKSLSTTEQVPPPSRSRNVNLPSALRHPGQGSVRSVMKRVAFSSPTFAEFNKLSPAENVTPMIVRRPSFSDKMFDDTAEIEIDMQTLMKYNLHNVQEAGRTPGAKHSLKRMDSIDDSNMSVDSTTIHISLNEPTMTLESDMLALLHDESLVKDSNAQEIQCAEENTIELETDINALLHVPATANDDSIHVGRRSLIFDDEPTFELEADINLLLPNDATGVNTSNAPFESRRFSIAPSRRLSVSLDGHFDHSTSENSAVVDVCSRGKTSDVAVFDLEVGEIVDFSSIRSYLLPNEKDLLIEVEHSMRVNGISDTMAAFTAQVLQMIESQTEPDIGPNSVVEMTDNTSHMFALQNYFRSEDKEEYSEVKTVASSLNEFDKF